jgi:hypothetical protein
MDDDWIKKLDTQSLARYIIINGEQKMQHLMNCHGEWNILLAMASSIPFAGLYIRSKIGGYNENDKNN